LDDIAKPASYEVDEAIVLTPVAPVVVIPRVWPVFVTFAAAGALATAFQIIIATVLVVAEAMRGGDIQAYANDLAGSITDPIVFMLLAGAGQLAFLVCALVPAWLSPVPMKQRLGLLYPRPSWRIGPALMIGSWASVGLGTALAAWLANYVDPSSMFEDLFNKVTVRQAIPFVLFIAIAPGIAEELLFRGYIQRRLLERWSPTWAITVTSILFALVHVQLHHMVAVFPIGLWLGFVAWKTESVVPSLLCHMFINGSVVAWHLVAKFADVDEAKNLNVQFMALALGVIYFLACMLRFARMSKCARPNEVMTAG